MVLAFLLGDIMKIVPIHHHGHLAADNSARRRLLDPRGNHIEQVRTAACTARKAYVGVLCCFFPKADLVDREVQGWETEWPKMRQFASSQCARHAALDNSAQPRVGAVRSHEDVFRKW